MLAELKKHGTMHIPQAVSQWEGNALGMVMLLPKQDVFHAQIGSTQIIIDKHIYIYIHEHKLIIIYIMKCKCMD